MRPIILKIIIYIKAFSLFYKFVNSSKNLRKMNEDKNINCTNQNETNYKKEISRLITKLIENKFMLLRTNI